MKRFLATAIATSVLVGFAGTATADPSSEAGAAAIAADVVAATGTNDIVPADAADTDSVAVVDNGATSIEIPHDSGDGVSVDTPAGAVGIALPGENVDALAVDGTVVYEEALPGVHAAVQATADGGVRVLVSIGDPSAPTEYRFPLDLPGGATATVDELGAVHLSTAAGDSLGGFAPAWAKDANGVPLPSRYRIEGDVLVQHVQLSAATAFPVIADPWYNPFSWNWHRIGRVTLNGLKKCGLGALGTTVGLGAGTATTNILRNRAGLAMIKVAGGPYAYVGAAAAGCVAAQFS